MKIGQHFFSKSKIQTTPIEYVYNGTDKNNRHHLICATGDPIDDVFVDTEWFDNREIQIINN